ANCRAELRYENELGRFSGKLVLSGTINLRTKFVLNTEKYVCERFENQTRSLTLYPKSNPGIRNEVFPDVALPKPEPDYFQEQLEQFIGAAQGWCDAAVEGQFGARSVKLIEEMYQQRRQLNEPWLLYRTPREENSCQRLK